MRMIPFSKNEDGSFKVFAKPFYCLQRGAEGMHELNSIYGVNTLMKFHPDRDRVEVNWEFSFLIADLFQTQKKSGFK